MLKSHEKFHSANGKRLVLVVDDEFINRELMGIALEADYEVIFAEDGQQALELIKEYHETLSLVLLDLMMPVLPGKEVLRRMKADPEMRQIPVIVLTADQKAEIESLNLGAADFIPKPYPEAGVILARILRTIELSEDRQIIQSTERDPLTGLYNREYFYRYAEQFDQHHRTLDMDAIVLDVNHFHMINERFGTAYGDEVLRRIGEKVREMVSDTGGIVCRRGGDTFMVYCPHGKDYRAILDNASIGLAGDDSADNRVRLRMGVYANVDKSLDVEHRFNRAKMAADTVRNSFTHKIALYDQKLHEHEIFAEQLIEEFPIAIREKQFQVYYQPKFDVRPSIPVLASAEALVRWIHPSFGMISPGVFIPLFEENGLIQRLDHYVWETAAQQIRDWRDRFGVTIPVSVNVSRVDMYDPELMPNLQHILSENDLTPQELYLEITESAYTQDSQQIIETVNALRNIGFKIEMDDFGTGYSSLNMISSLPIDALKLDMQFIRAAFNERKDTRMIEVIIDIADYLSVPVIAEGVETEEQLNALRDMGCDIVQGYYFSRPLPSHEYEHYVVERRDQIAQGEDTSSNPLRKTVRAHNRHRNLAFERIAYALSNGFESVFYVDTDTNHYVEFSSDSSDADLQIRRSGDDFFANAQANITNHVLKADQQRMLLCLQKDTLLDQLIQGRSFSMTYRIDREGTPVYYSLKAVSATTHDDHHIVMGIGAVDEHILHTDVPEGSNEPSFNSLAQALSSDMESIYYVDTATDAYEEFVTGGSYGSLRLETTGTNFFDDCRTNIDKVIYDEDRERLFTALEKTSLLSAIHKRGSFSMDYRLVVDGKPLFYRLKAIPARERDISRIIIGVSNVDAQITESQKLEAIRQSAGTYSRIARALAEDYFCIYYVDTETDQFIEYSAYGEYSELGIERSGDDFFELSRKNMAKVGHPDDLSQFLASFTKERILRELEENGAFTITYRLLFNGMPTYVHMKATRMAEKDDPHIVIGVSNIDAQMRREHERAQALRSAKEAAYRDPLTGVKSKLAYTEAQESLDTRISAGNAEEFAVVLCDVNDLKEVNDTQGHAAGDEVICSACREVCTVFTHSPVYRYGGDEFVVILRGHDYRHRHELMELVAADNRERAAEGGVVIACGMSEYQPGLDHAMVTVFKRADEAMYLNKKELKAQE